MQRVGKLESDAAQNHTATATSSSFHIFSDLYMQTRGWRDGRQLMGVRLGFANILLWFKVSLWVSSCQKVLLGILSASAKEACILSWKNPLQTLLQESSTNLESLKKVDFAESRLLNDNFMDATQVRLTSLQLHVQLRSQLLATSQHPMVLRILFKVAVFGRFWRFGEKLPFNLW